MSTSTITSGEQSVSAGRLAQGGAIAALVAVSANGLLFIIVTTLLAIKIAVPGAVGELLGIGPVIASSAVGGIAGALVLGGLMRFTRRPLFWFNIVSIIFTLVSLIPLMAPGIDGTSRLVLGAMHVIAALSVVLTLNWFVQRR